MHLIVTGILTDSRGRVLLRQVGTHELAPISRPVEPGTLPADTLARAFREDTTLFVLPVRLTGLYYRNRPPGGELAFVYRCTMRGGELAENEQRVGFFDALPSGLPAWLRQPIEQALRHAGGPPHMRRVGRGPGGRLRRLFGAPAESDSEPAWSVTVKLAGLLPGEAVMWTKLTPEQIWRLPATAVAGDETPWEAAARLLTNMELPGAAPALEPALIHIDGQRATMAFVFIAALDSPPPTDERWLVARTDSPAENLFSDDAAGVLAARQAANRPIFQLARESE